MINDHNLKKKFLVVLLSLLPLTKAAALEKDPHATDTKSLIFFDAGYKMDQPRRYEPGEVCTSKPCIISKFGSIHFSDIVRKNYAIELGLFHDGSYKSIALFEEGPNLDEKFGERFLNKRQNRPIFDLENAIQNSLSDTLYVYGIKLHYQLDEGDVIIIKLTDNKNNHIKKAYYFRYHLRGMIWDADVAVISPLKLFIPNPNGVIRNANISIALSTSFGWYMDPEKKYSFGRKFLHAWRFNTFLGLLKRTEFAYEGGTDKYTDVKVDGFFGAGFTFVDFFVGGFGINLARSPHSFFPFVGIEVKHLYQFIRSLKTSSKKKWQKYLKEQQGFHE